MTASSPADLAVAFRSLGRRLREALEGSDAEVLAAASAPVAELRSVVASAAAELGLPGPVTPDLSTTGDAIAAAIEKVPADEWDDAQLNRLRQLALDAGRLLRVVSGLTGHDD